MSKQVDVCTKHILSFTGGVFDSEELIWNRSAFEKIGLRTDILADPVPGDAVASSVTPTASRISGLPEGIPVIAGTGDSMAALLGHRVFNPGDMMIYLGSSATRILLNGSVFDFLNTAHFGPGKAEFLGKNLSCGDSMEHFQQF